MVCWACDGPDAAATAMMVASSIFFIPISPRSILVSPNPLLRRPQLSRAAFGDEQGRRCRLLSNWHKLLIGGRIIPATRLFDVVECNNHKTLRHTAFKRRQLARG